MTPTTTVQRSLDEQSDDGIERRLAIDGTPAGSPEVRR
jgi:hypothetical protein